MNPEDGSLIVIDPSIPDDNEMSQVRRFTPDQLLPESEIPIKYDKASRGAIAYLALAAEMVRRQKAAEDSSEQIPTVGDSSSTPVQHTPENPVA